MMTKLKNDCLIRALLRQPVDRPPIWLMRQAGRYLPEYRQVRQQAGDFMTLCRTPELACEVTLQPIRRFGFDAAIIFSDILTIPDAMGLGLHFVEGSGPHFERPVRTEMDVTKLTIDVEASLDYVYQAVATTARALNHEISLIGFAGSPWTLATYMVEGGPSKSFSIIKKMLYAHPALLTRLLNQLADAVAQYLNLQIKAGANAVMIFDTWGGVLTREAYQQFSLQPIKRIVSQLTRRHQGQTIPVIMYTKGGGQWLTEMVTTGVDALGIDWMTDLTDAKKRVGDQVALQGNLDPSVLYASPETIQTEVEKMLAVFKEDPGYVVNLGHGIYPDVPPEHVQVMVDTVKNYHRVKA